MDWLIENNNELCHGHIMDREMEHIMNDEHDDYSNYSFVNNLLIISCDCLRIVNELKLKEINWNKVTIDLVDWKLIDWFVDNKKWYNGQSNSYVQ